MSETPADLSLPVLPDVAVVGGGPAGLRAAEVAAGLGASIVLFDAKPSFGRKFLVAGKGGMNLTHGEAFEDFIARYSGPSQPPDRWRTLVGGFTPDDLRAWAADLGVETFQASTGRVYPREMTAAPLLRRWVQKLRGLGVRFGTRHRWTGLVPGAPHRLTFDTPDGPREISARTIVFALGGASWPITGSDGTWLERFSGLGIACHPLQPANCGWETPWSPETLSAAEGQPLKNLVVRANGIESRGELMVTAYGLEGGALYRLGAELRAMAEPIVHLDFKPTFTLEELEKKMESVRRDFLAEAERRWKLGTAAAAIVAQSLQGEAPDTPRLAGLVKACPVRFTGPRPIDEAISSAGGICWEEIDDRLMLRKLPGIFVAGEMIDWEAPTGGYLMQGCFASGTRAGSEAVAHARA